MTEGTKLQKMGRPPKYTSAQSMADMCKQYFTDWEAQNRPLTILGLAGYLDMCYDTLCEYGNGVYDHIDTDFPETVKRAKEYIGCHKWEAALTGKYHAAVSIFDLKNNHGAVDKVEYTGRDGAPLHPAQQTVLIRSASPEEAKRKYDELLESIK